MAYKVVYNIYHGGFSLSQEAIDWLAKKGYTTKVYSKMPRHHPLLVECVETLGDKAAGRFSKLKIAEVECYYIINDVNGIEFVIAPEYIKWINPSEKL